MIIRLQTQNKQMMKLPSNTIYNLASKLRCSTQNYLTLCFIALE